MADLSKEVLSPEVRKANLVKDLNEISKVKGWEDAKSIAQVDALVKQDPLVAALEQYEINNIGNTDPEILGKSFYEMVDPVVRQSSGSVDVTSNEYVMELHRAGVVRNEVRDLRQTVMKDQIASAKNTEILEVVLEQAPEISAFMRNQEDAKAEKASILRYSSSLELVRAFREKRGELVRNEILMCNNLADVDNLSNKYPEIKGDLERSKGVQADANGMRPYIEVPNEELYPNDFGELNLQRLRESAQEKRTMLVEKAMEQTRDVKELNTVLTEQLPSFTEVQQKIKTGALKQGGLSDEAVIRDFDRFGNGSERLVKISQGLRTAMFETDLAKAVDLNSVNALEQSHPQVFAVLKAGESTDPADVQAGEKRIIDESQYLYGAESTDKLTAEVRDKRGEIVLGAMDMENPDVILAQDPELLKWATDRGSLLKEAVRTVAENVGVGEKALGVYELYNVEEKLARRYGYAVMEKLAEKITKNRSLLPSTTGGK